MAAPAGHFDFFQDLVLVENLLLAAANLGATRCGMEEKRREVLRPILGIPEDYGIFAVIPESPPPRTPYDPGKVPWERFGNRGA